MCRACSSRHQEGVIVPTCGAGYLILAAAADQRRLFAGDVFESVDASSDPSHASAHNSHKIQIMDRRMFLQLAAAPALLASDEPPLYKVVSHYPAAKSSEMPGPYRGAVARIHSETVIDPASERIDQPTVDKMLSAGIKGLTGAKADKEAWSSFFSSSDVVGIK